ncbi:Uncharacterized amino acid permease, GabP family [hydrothermal vent metagenome]|uniref:Uncharacterized amino acid permease, GabP family n=1 Tax=hydrothermal vent metagenome TaxID=652676 RepID=A0A3B1DCG7_9ZZZZ
MIGKKKKLKKELNLIDVFAIATGSTISGGFFLIPGLAAAEVGNAFVLAYLLSAILLIPSVLSKIELATAMPRAGGVYYFLDRSLGPGVGTIGGIGVWLVLILKVSFALVGIGAYLSLFVTSYNITMLAVFIAIILGIVNYFGAKKSSNLQIVLVSILLIIIAGFIVTSIPFIEPSNYNQMFDFKFLDLMSTTGLVFISYVGVTKIASISEEIKNPERNIPLGIFLALGTAFIVYILGTMIIVGIVPMDILRGNLTAVATVEELKFGNIGVIIIAVAAIVAFISVANSGIMSASRYPLAMSRDHIIPASFRKLTKNNIPTRSLMLTVLLIIIVLLVFDPTKIAKLASAFQLLAFAFISLSVIVMRESKIESYDPGYKSPFYPWMQIIGIAVSLFLIFQLGILSILFTIGLILIGGAWYFFYSKSRVTRNGAIYHVFERWGKSRYAGIDTELRGILKEKGLRKGDPFDQIVMQSKVFELPENINFEKSVDATAEWLATKIPISKEDIIKRVMEGTRVGATPVTRGVALPHFRCEGIDHSMLVLLRTKSGIDIPIFNPLTYQEEDVQRVTAVFFLISPEKDPTQHLRMLAQIAGRVDEESFAEEWYAAKDEQELREALLHDDNFQALHVFHGKKTESLINKPLKEIDFPSGCLVTLLQRGGEIIVPKGNTKILEGDRITIIGDPESMQQLRKLYVN